MILYVICILFLISAKYIRLLYKMSEQLKDFVKARRKELKMTQQSLADKSGVGIHFIRDIEQGKQDLRIKKVNQVLFMFGAKLAPVPLDKEDRQ